MMLPLLRHYAGFTATPARCHERRRIICCYAAFADAAAAIIDAAATPPLFDGLMPLLLISDISPFFFRLRCAAYFLRC